MPIFFYLCILHNNSKPSEPNDIQFSSLVVEINMIFSFRITIVSMQQELTSYVVFHMYALEAGHVPIYIQVFSADS